MMDGMRRWKRGHGVLDPNSGAPVVLKVDRARVNYDTSWGIVAGAIQER
jgi:hypothetical protein